MRISLFKVAAFYLGGRWTAWGGRRRIERKQLRNLRKLVAKARRDSPFFRRLYESLPETRRLTLPDLPVTSKPQLMGQFDDWVTDRSLKLADLRAFMSDLGNIGLPCGDVAVFRTSGTSGEPAVVVLTSRDIECLFGVMLARLSRSQLRRLPELHASGANVTITGANGHFVGSGLAPLIGHLTRRYPEWLGMTASHALHIAAEQPIEQIVQQLNQIGDVAVILTYPSTLSILLREMEAGRLKMNPLLIKVAGETLTPALRDHVRKVFPAQTTELIDAYACTECLMLSVECACGRKHLPEDWVVLEAVDADLQPVPDGVMSSSSLLTVLTNTVQPFIRYELGDQIQFYPDRCPCGSAFRSFKVIGRQATLLQIGDVVLSPLVFDLDHEDAQRVQLVQTGEHEFDLRCEVRHEAHRDRVFDEVGRSVANTLRQNGASGFSIQRSQEPPRLTASGKFHEVIPLKRTSRLPMAARVRPER